MDCAAEYDHYTADITRTMPINGKFTKEQAEIYNDRLRRADRGDQTRAPREIHARRTTQDSVHGTVRGSGQGRIAAARADHVEGEQRISHLVYARHEPLARDERARRGRTTQSRSRRE